MKRLFLSTVQPEGAVLKSLEGGENVSESLLSIEDKILIPGIGREVYAHHSA
jgi:hypothetical protein